MKKHRERILKILFCLLCFTILLLAGIILHQVNDAKKQIADKTPVCLGASVRKYIESKMGGAYYSAQYEYDPSKGRMGEYETRTARYADTTFTYRSEIVDPGTAALRGFQTGFLDIGQLYADSIQVILDSLLQANDIHVQSVVGITASFYTKKNEWSGDTTAIDINYRTAITNQGNYEDINYYAYIHYSPRSIWILMNKTLICILFIGSIVIGFTLLWWLRKCKKEQINGVTQLQNGDYRIKDILFYVNDRRLVAAEKESKLSDQLHELFLLFLQAGNHRVEKKEIKEKLWPGHTNPTTNMTSTIGRLNIELKRLECTYTIITDPKNEGYYLFAES